MSVEGPRESLKKDCSHFYINFLDRDKLRTVAYKLLRLLRKNVSVLLNGDYCFAVNLFAAIIIHLAILKMPPVCSIKF